MKATKSYLLNGKSVTSYELIKEAEKLDIEFKEAQVKFTSEAAEIIRSFGGTVENNYVDNGINFFQQN